MTEELDIDLTKYGLLEALNRYAAHADKGQKERTRP
jgi:hypothetical protein